MTSIRINLPIPPKPLWPNARPHWATKARAVKGYRTLAQALTMVALRCDKPRWPLAEVTATFFFKTNRRRDRDNCLAALKAAFDGLTDSGLIADDSGLIHMPIQFGASNPKDPHVTLVISQALNYPCGVERQK